MTESEMLEIDERARLASKSLDDAAVVQRYAARAAAKDVPELLSALRDAYAERGGGGDLGVLLRNALRARIVSASNGPGLGVDLQRVAVLSDDVQVHSLSVHSIGGQARVMIDIRLAVGDAPVLT